MTCWTVWSRRATVFALVAAVSGCAGNMKQARSAAARGDWDSAVAYYREIVASEPKNLEARIQMERAMRNAASA